MNRQDVADFAVLWCALNIAPIEIESDPGPRASTAAYRAIERKIGTAACLKKWRALKAERAQILAAVQAIAAPRPRKLARRKSK